MDIKDALVALIIGSAGVAVGGGAVGFVYKQYLKRSFEEAERRIEQIEHTQCEFLNKEMQEHSFIEKPSYCLAQ